MLPPAWRRLTLAVHIICSVGWIGAAAAYLALGLAAQLSQRGQLVRAAWLAMDLTGWYVIVPLGCLALVTGLVVALSTPWGLVRYYWVLIAFGLTSFALVILILHMPTVTATAEHAAQVDDAAAAQLGGDLLHPGGGLVVLVFVAVLNVYKTARPNRIRQADPVSPAAARPRQPARLNPTANWGCWRIVPPNP
jgi:hypothetical protein